VVSFPRCFTRSAGLSIQDHSPLCVFRLLPVGSLTSVGLKGSPGLRGFGPLGADFWHVIPKQWGRRVSVIGRVPVSGKVQGHSLDLNGTAHRLLMPGRGGPVATVRFECLREGLQEVEARIFIEKVLADPARRARLGEELAARSQEILDDQFRAFRLGAVPKPHCSHDPVWYAGSGWQERSARIYRAAAEVAGKLPAESGQ
jgi:hypothetical protein